jgi:hypothetical protein
MDVDLDHLKRRFASMSDEALLDMDPEELVDVARECYHAEVAERGLMPDAEDAPDPSASLEQPVLLATFTDLHEAQFAQALLESAQIPCSFDDTRSTLRTIAELRLMVPASLIEAAREVLETEISDEELAAQAEALPPPED